MITRSFHIKAVQEALRGHPVLFPVFLGGEAAAGLVGLSDDDAGAA